MEQLSFLNPSSQDYLIEQFSSDALCSDIERKMLESRYAPLLEVTDRFDRRSVSYQLSKNEILHSWLKYKEGFSADLVQLLLHEMGAHPGDLVMDPFMGSGTTALVCQMQGINSIGYDVMPIADVSLKAKAACMEYDLPELRAILEELKSLHMPDSYSLKTPCIPITQDAYPEYNERYLQFIEDWRIHCIYSENAKNLLRLCILNSLEPCSYTVKSGQYLGWDSRSPKVIHANELRAAKGKKPLSAKTVRSNILDSRDTVLLELSHVIHDLEVIQHSSQTHEKAQITYKQNSVLFELPRLPDNILKGVITSPPYCNRYDYTRTYALELVYLGLDNDSIKQLRQDLLSCTVESRSKLEQLKLFYTKIGQIDRFHTIHQTLCSNPAFCEVLDALHKREQHGDLNNSGIVRMVEGYFTELAFIYAELFRVCKKGAMVAFVNDNVRYGGEVIPVDFLSCSLAEQFGFTVKKVYCLKQKKGNSSQQMAKFGRVALRKSITIWVKA